MIKIQKRLKGELNSAEHAKIWLLSYAAALFFYSVHTLFLISDAAPKIISLETIIQTLAGLAIWAPTFALPYALTNTLIPALMVGGLLLNDKITDFIERKKFTSLAISFVSIATTLIIMNLLNTTIFLNGIFALEWKKLFRHVDVMAAIIFLPCLLYITAISFKISFKKKSKTE